MLGKGPITHEVKFTHRGPILDSDLVKNTQDLFIGKCPLTEKYGQFSLAWAYNYPGDNMIDYMIELMKAESIPAFKTSIQSKISKYVSMGINFHLADRDGNIGFHGLSATPLRKNSYPHVG